MHRFGGTRIDSRTGHVPGQGSLCFRATLFAADFSAAHNGHDVSKHADEENKENKEKKKERKKKKRADRDAAIT